MNSVEKVRALLQELRTAAPEDEEDAGKLAMLQAIAPVAVGYLPDTPDELDTMLAKGAQWALSLRSDDAPPLEPAQELEASADEVES